MDSELREINANNEVTLSVNHAWINWLSLQ
jgi:hypothetical protein